MVDISVYLAHPVYKSRLHRTSYPFVFRCIPNPPSTEHIATARHMYMHTCIHMGISYVSGDAMTRAWRALWQMTKHYQNRSAKGVIVVANTDAVALDHDSWAWREKCTVLGVALTWYSLFVVRILATVVLYAICSKHIPQNDPWGSRTSVHQYISVFFSVSVGSAGMSREVTVKTFVHHRRDLCLVLICIC